LTAHLDLLPTLVAVTGAPISPALKKQVEGRSLLPLFENPDASWGDRTLIHHVARWDRGQSQAAKYQASTIQNSRFTLVNNTELYDLTTDPGETTNVIAKHPEAVAALRATYDQWWTDVQPDLVNETAVGPTINPMKALYWKQFGGGPTEEDMKLMDPSATTTPR
jgi:arylsulfatase